MPGRLRRLVLLALAALTVSLGLVGNASAQLTPPWCGTPVPDAAGEPAGRVDRRRTRSAASRTSRTTRSVHARQHRGAGDRRPHVRRADRRLGARPPAVRRRHSTRWRRPQQTRLQPLGQKYRELAARGSRTARRHSWTVGRRGQGPGLLNERIHGNEYEGVEWNMQLIKELATTPYGAESEDRRHTSTTSSWCSTSSRTPTAASPAQRANGNGFDLNRDLLTQSQSEMQASVELQQKWLAGRAARPARLRDADPVESTTKPHAPQHRVRPHGSNGTRAGRRRTPTAMRVGRARDDAAHPDWCPEAEHPAAERALPRREHSRPGGRRRLGRLGPVLHGRVRTARRASTRRRSRCATRRTSRLRSARVSTTHQRGRLGAYLRPSAWSCSRPWTS